MGDRPARLKDFSLSRNLKGDRLLHRAERVHILHLGTRTERCILTWANRDICLNAHLPVLHLRIGGADGAQQEAELFGVAAGRFRITNVWLGHDLKQRNTGAVVVDEAGALPVTPLLVPKARRILFEVRAVNAHATRSGARRYLNGAVLGEREVELTDLVSLREVWIEVVLAIPDRGRWRSGADRGTNGKHLLNGGLVRHWECAGEAEAGWTGLAVRQIALGGNCAGAEHLRHRAELHVHLDADHCMPGHAATPRALATNRPMRTSASRRFSSDVA